MIPLRDSIPSRHTPWMTWAIIGACTLVFVVETLLPRPVLESVITLLGIVPARYTHPEWAAAIGFPADDYWPFLTSMFLHGSWGHLLGNMWFLWIFGDNVEDRMGPWRYLLFYLLCGVAAGVVHWWTNPASTVPTVGASGAIAGVMGAYMVMFPHSRIIVMLPLLFWPLVFEVPAVLFLFYWFALQLVTGTASLLGPGQVGGVAWWAHVGGFVFGVLCYRLFLRRRRRRRLFPDEFGLEAGWFRDVSGRNPWV